MKTTHILFISLLLLSMSSTSYAQFNTIGSVSSRRIHKQKDHPSEQDAPKDSLCASDTTQYNINVGEIMNLPTDKEGVQTFPLVSFPLSHIHVNSKFGMRFHPVYHKKMLHNGIDLQARYEPVYSIFPGRVIRIGYDSRSGNFVTIQSADYTISYCHLSKTIVSQGSFIEAGTPIAISGNSGASTGPHLHLTVKNNGKAVNPAIILKFISMCTSTENPHS